MQQYHSFFDTSFTTLKKEFYKFSKENFLQKNTWVDNELMSKQVENKKYLKSNIPIFHIHFY